MRATAPEWGEVEGFLYLDGRMLGKVPETVGIGETPLSDVVSRAKDGDSFADMALRWHATLFLERQLASLRGAL